MESLHIPSLPKVLILGGKNGYGKTTLFDAIELLLTGKIIRYEDYARQADHRVHINDSTKPLVFSMDEPLVYVQATVEKEGRKITLKRKAWVEGMKNPPSFKVFDPLYVVEGNEDKPISDEEKRSFNLEALSRHYTFLNYLEQENATAFLKRNEKDRSISVGALFNTTIFDRRIECIDSTVSKAQSGLEVVNQLLNDKTETLNALSNAVKPLEGEATPYSRLVDKKDFGWDSQVPVFTLDDYNKYLGENGVLDEILYLVDNYEYFTIYRTNVVAQRLLNEGLLKKLATFECYHSKETEIERYVNDDQPLINAIQGLTFDIASLDGLIQKLTQFDGSVVTVDHIRPFVERLHHLKGILEGASSIEKAYVGLRNTRDVLLENLHLIDQQEPGISECPLCGHPYASPQELLGRIQKTGEKIESDIQSIKNFSTSDFDLLKKELAEKVVIPIVQHYAEIGITYEKALAYHQLNKPEVFHIQNAVNQRFEIHQLSEERTEEEIFTYYTAEVNSKIKTLDATIDYEKLTRVFETYGKYISKENRTKERVESKKRYLLEQWNRGAVNQTSRLQAGIDRLKKNKAKYDGLLKQLNNLKKFIQNRKKAYLNSLINDVKITFFVYSGRVLQDSLFGRGIRLEYDSNKYVRFLSAKGDSTDILYKLSSGQLVAVVMAFVMTLNRLYAETPILLIDDPIQTIDDINIWGLIETMRHSFADRQLIFSTHEPDYGLLMDYKFKRFAMDSKYEDMLDIRKRIE
jgi:DNA repair exonuclease SbcCD ATPase subunit